MTSPTAMKKCDICGGTTATAVIADMRDNLAATDQVFAVVRCDDCGHFFTDPIPTAEELDMIYPKQYYAHVGPQKNLKVRGKWYLKKKCHRPVDGGLHIRLLNKLLAEPAFRENGRLLDVGCGNGEYLLFAQECGWQVAGVEPDKEAVDHLREGGLDIKQGIAEDLPFESGSFDVVRAWHSLEHTVSPTKALKEIRRVLKDDGRALIGVPNFGCAQSQAMGRHWPALEVPRHLQHFTEDSLKRALAEAGLEKECDFIYSGIPFFDIMWRLAVYRQQHFDNATAYKNVARSVGQEMMARLARKDTRAFLTWWVRPAS